MSADAIPVLLRHGLVAHAPPSEFDLPAFEERWAAWRARGAAHDREVRRKAMAMAPSVALGAAIWLMYFR